MQPVALAIRAGTTWRARAKPDSDQSGLLQLTGVKRSAFGRLSGRQRSYADEVEGGRSDSDQATVGRTTSPLRGTPCGSLFSTPSTQRERGLPTRHSLHSLRERRLPLDVTCNDRLPA